MSLPKITDVSVMFSSYLICTHPYSIHTQSATIHDNPYSVCIQTVFHICRDDFCDIYLCLLPLPAPFIHEPANVRE